MRILILLAIVFSFGWSVIAWLALRARDGRVKETVVERQVVVVRCSFCSEMRAVELAACEHCGARSLEAAHSMSG